MSPTIHEAVMTSEVMEFLRPHDGGVYVDATLGGGTHTRELLERSAPNGHVYAFDVDPGALERARETLASYGDRFMAIEANFRDMTQVLQDRGVHGVDGILIDLGVSSDELMDASKGLSFRVAGPLDMRLGPRANDDGLTAADIVNTWSEADLERVLREDGEERYARRIASAIVAMRKERPIATTLDLTEVIRSAAPASYEHGRIHPATRTFQALRIAVNDELGALRDAIQSARNLLKPDGVITIISFHSLEDRIVKHAFRDADDLEPLTKRPLEPTEEEVSRNPRARSAKVRGARKKE